MCLKLSSGWMRCLGHSAQDKEKNTLITFARRRFLSSFCRTLKIDSVSAVKKPSLSLSFWAFIYYSLPVKVKTFFFFPGAAQ